MFFSVYFYSLDNVLLPVCSFLCFMFNISSTVLFADKPFSICSSTVLKKTEPRFLVCHSSRTVCTNNDILSHPLSDVRSVSGRCTTRPFLDTIQTQCDLFIIFFLWLFCVFVFSQYSEDNVAGPTYISFYHTPSCPRPKCLHWTLHFQSSRSETPISTDSYHLRFPALSHMLNF